MNILSISQARGIIFALFLSLSFTSSQSQNLTDQMGGVKTNYRIIAGYSELKTVNQAIFKRTITINHQDNHSKHSRIENKEVYVLEFISTDRMYISDRVRFKYWLELWDENNQIYKISL